MLSAAKISRRLHLEWGTGRQLSRSQPGRPTGLDVLSVCFSVCLDKKVRTQPSAGEDQPVAKTGWRVIMELVVMFVPALE